MKRILVFLLAIFVPLVAMGGSIDNRYYVTDEMWATDPYNKFVHLKMDGGSCSAQYIAPNLILTAGHCGFEHVRAINYKKQTFDLQLVYNRHKEKYFGTEDWAVFLVKDSKYYSDAFFEPEKIKQQTDLLHAGWGWVRILTDDEIDIISELLESMTNKRASRTDVMEIFFILKDELKKKGIESIRDERDRLKASRCNSVEPSNCDELIKKEDQYHDELRTISVKIDECLKEKSYDDCNELITQRYDGVEKYDEVFRKLTQCQRDNGVPYPNIIKHTCTTWQGDSGGGFVSDDKSNKLYGVVSYHSGVGFEPARFMASSWQFAGKIKELRETYSTSNSDEQNVRMAKSVLMLSKMGIPFEDSVIAVSADSNETTNESEEITTQELEERIEMLSDDMRQTESDVMEQLKNIKSLGQNAKLKLIDNIVAYEVKSEQLAELQKAYEEAKARETSLPNRMLGAAAIGATGIGGMMLASAVSEQRVDTLTEQEMQAYLKTFTCEYGGNRVAGGETNVELAGGNDMISLYTEYATLANDLKTRKELLGIAPGIESKVVIDKAETGLYDDAGVGITSGVYASIARAIMNPDGEDAAKWNEQRAKTGQRVKTGAVVAGAGAIGGAVGNILINHTNKDKTTDEESETDKSDDDKNDAI